MIYILNNIVIQQNLEEEEGMDVYFVGLISSCASVAVLLFVIGVLIGCLMKKKRRANEQEHSRTAAQSNRSPYTDLNLNDVDLHEYETHIDRPTFEEKSPDQRVVYTNTREDTEGEYENAAMSTRSQHTSDCYEVLATE